MAPNPAAAKSKKKHVRFPRVGDTAAASPSRNSPSPTAAAAPLPDIRRGSTSPPAAQTAAKASPATDSDSADTNMASVSTIPLETPEPFEPLEPHAEALADAPTSDAPVNGSCPVPKLQSAAFTTKALPISDTDEGPAASAGRAPSARSGHSGSAASSRSAGSSSNIALAEAMMALGDLDLLDKLDDSQGGKANAERTEQLVACEAMTVTQRLMISRIAEMLLQNSEHPNIVMLPNCEIVAVSASVEGLFGYTATQLIGRNIDILMPPDIAAKHDSYVRSYCISGRDRPSAVVGAVKPTMGMHREGHLVPIETSVRVAWKAGANGAREPALFVGQIRDCRTESKMRIGLEQAQLLESAFPFPYIMTSEDGTIEKWNPAAEQVFGYSAAYMMGQNVTTILPRKVARNHAGYMRNYVRSIRQMGVANVKSTAVNVTSSRFAVGLPRRALEHRGAKSTALDMFKVELTVRVSLSNDGSIKFMAFLRDLRTFQTEDDVSKETALLTTALQKVFPRQVAQEYVHGSTPVSEQEASVIFCDIVGFSGMQLTPTAMLDMLTDLFSRFDRIGKAMPGRVTPIKIVGDLYMCATGLFGDKAQQAQHAEAAVEFACHVLREVREFNAATSSSIQVRIGISSGTVVSGVVETARPAFDLYGKTVNMAARAESTGVPDLIHIPRDVYGRLGSTTRALFVKREETVEFKNIGPTETWLSQPMGQWPSALVSMLDHGMDEGRAMETTRALA